MKVWELIAKLSAYSAGAEIRVSMCNTLNGNVENVIFNGDEVKVSGGDAEVVNSEGETIGRLSDLAEYEEL